MANPSSLMMSALRERYRAGRQTPHQTVTLAFDAADRAAQHNVWITRLSRDQVMSYVDALDVRAFDDLPLFGIPFVIKDNIDLAGVPTTAGCAAFAYTPASSATVVRKLLAAGAIPLGKTNLDQFATGLVGVRSPYGACRNAVNPDYISGGSSSGSAVAVALGLASFSLGTDTAGSGRVPAAFNDIVGLKPSNGLVSTHGVVPACRSLDCVSIFALSVPDAAAVLDVAQGFDAADSYARCVVPRKLTGLKFGVPRADQRQFFGDADYAQLFDHAVRQCRALGGAVVELDFAPFFEAARLLYEGPWVAERFAAVGAFIDAHADDVHPVTRAIIQSGKLPGAVAAFKGQYRLKELERLTMSAWSRADLLLTPTAGTIYRIDAVERDPFALNATLGLYTNFLNFFGLSGVAVPAGFRADGLPFGVTLVGPPGADHDLLDVAHRLHCALDDAPGRLAAPDTRATNILRDGDLPIAVCGAHMQGLPLNHQLLDRGGYRIAAVSTAPHYRLFALPGGPPHRPGLVRVNDGGARVEVEVWGLPSAHLGAFVAAIPAPLGIGKIELSSGEWVSGFVCEPYALEAAADITHYGGWRAYLEAVPT